ncbi:MAG: RNA polymerase sigma factor, partial [Terracidiphilus sp.]
MGLAWPSAGASRPRLTPEGESAGQGRIRAGHSAHAKRLGLSVEIPVIGPAVRPAPVEAAALESDWSQLVRQCMAGDSGAWAQLVRAQHRRVYGLCYRFTGNAADAEDLTQDVFLKIYSNLASFDLGRGSLQVWIATMTRNLLVDNFRRTKNQRATSSLD